MLKLENLTKETFRDNVLNSIKKDNDLNINTSEYSFVYKIIDALASGNNENINYINEVIKENDISELKGKSLDNFFELFNLKRKKYHKNLYLFEITYFGELNFTIKEKTLLTYENENYIVINDVNFNNQDKTFQIHTKKLTQNNLTINNSIKISDLLISTEYINKDILPQLKLELTNNALLNYFGIEEYDIETDESFLNRGTNLLQMMSSDSKFKILNEIKTIEGVYSCYFTQEDLTNFLTIIPTDINQIDNLIKEAKEIVDFFKNTRIEILKPNYVEFKINNLFKQGIKEQDKEKIKEWISNWIRTLYLKNLTFDRHKFEMELNNLLLSINPMYKLNFNMLEIKYKLYIECDFNLLFEQKKIYTNETKEFNNSIFVCKEVI